MKRPSAAGLIPLIVACPLFAQKEAPLPKDLPAYGPQPAFRAPDVKESKLANGLTVWLVSQPGLPKVSFRIAVLGGLASDPPDRPGMSELLAKTLSQGTKTRSAKQIAEEIQSAGGDLEVDSDRDTFSVSTSVLSSKVDPAAELLADALENASFPENEVTLAKRNLISSLREREAQPRFQANRALAQALFGSGPYSVVAPTEASLNQTSVEDLRREFARRFRPDQSILVAVGDFETVRMTTLIQQKFSSWTSPSAQPAVVDAKPRDVAPHTAIIVPRPNSVQTTLLLAAFGPLRRDPDYEATDVANAMYGGAFSSRLVTNIREDKGYTYSPGSRLATLRQAGVLRTQADVRNAVTGASVNEIMYELNRMATTTPTDEELSRAKRSLLGVEAIFLQSRGSVADEISTQWVEGLGPDAIANHTQKINATTVADVDAAARKYFPASRMTVVAVGEDKVVRDELSPFGLSIKTAQ